MKRASLSLRTIVLAGCAAAPLVGLFGTSTAVQASPLRPAAISHGDGMAADGDLRRVANRPAPGRRYARRAGLYTCGATSTGTHLNRMACGGGNKMRTYPR